jgi:hypothetical protein
MVVTSRTSSIQQLFNSRRFVRNATALYQNRMIRNFQGLMQNSQTVGLVFRTLTSYNDMAYIKQLFTLIQYSLSLSSNNSKNLATELTDLGNQISALKGQVNQLNQINAILRYDLSLKAAAAPSKQALFSVSVQSSSLLSVDNKALEYIQQYGFHESLLSANR